ncbi:MAG: sodium:calcium antiporter, partial [Pseudomonadota bacterium]
LGSNIFNLLGIIGVAALFGPIPVDPTFFHIDFWMMLFASLLLAPFVFAKRGIGRGLGAVFVLIYAAYLTLTLMGHG